MPPSVGLNIVEFKGTLNYQGAEKQPSPKPPPVILPVRNSADDFVGRSGELKRLADLLLAPEGGRRAWIVGLAGSGGIGKSALAFQFAELHQADFPGGVIGCQVNGKDLAAVAREFARKAGEPVREEDERDPAEIMQNVFAWRRALLIFDNAETTEIGGLHPGGQCAVLVTTRDRRLPVIIGAELLELPPLPEPEARVLLARFVGEERLNKEPEAAARILAVTGKLPLAVEIAGKFLQNRSRMPLKDYADSLSLARLTLARTDKESEDKNFSVRVCFNESVRLLEAEGRSRALILGFARLAACAQSGFALSTAMAAMDAPDSAAALDTLEELRNYSLLNYAGESGSRFLFHPLLHEFAGELAKERDELAEAKQRHAAHCGRLLEDGAGNELAEDMDDLVRAAEWVVENLQGNWPDFYMNLKPLFDRLGHWEEADRIATLFLRRAEQENNTVEAVRFHFQLVKFRLIKNDVTNAAAFLRTAEELIQTVEPPMQRDHLQAMQLILLGGIYQRLGQFDEALYTLEKKYELDEFLDNQSGQARTLNSLGGVYQRLGQFDKAVEAFSKSAEIGEELKDQRHLAMVLNSLGGVFQRLGQFDKAVEAFSKSYELAVSFDDQRGQAMVLNSLGGVHQRLGQFDKAIEVFSKSLEIRETQNDQRGLAMVLNSLGGVYQRLGQFDKAIEAFSKSAEIGEELKDQRHLAMVLNSLGGVYQRLGQFDKAVEAFSKSVEIGEKLDDQRHLAMVLNSLGGVYQRLGQFDKAVEAFSKSYEQAVSFDDQRGQAMVLNSLGGVYQRLGQFDKAVEAFSKSYEQAVSFDDQRGQAMVLNSLGGVYQRQGKLDEAVQAFTKSAAIGERFNDRRHLAMVCAAWGRALLEHGQPNAAIAKLERSFAINEKLEDRVSLGIVTPLLCQALRQLGHEQEAADRCARALALAPGNAKLLALQRSREEQPLLVGTVKFISPAKDGGHSFGYLSMDDGGADVRVDSRHVDITGLSKGARVEAEVRTNRYGGRVAARLTKIT